MDVLTLRERDIGDISDIAPTSEYIAGVAKLPDGLVLIHDLATFLSNVESEALTAVVEQGLPA
jgi:purine-binding chemotaxis protein CheW